MWDTTWSDIDCETYNASSASVTCDDVDLCCDDQECWYQTDDGRTDSADHVLDLLCTFSWQTPVVVESFNLGLGSRSRWSSSFTNWVAL